MKLFIPYTTLLDDKTDTRGIREVIARVPLKTLPFMPYERTNVREPNVEYSQPYKNMLEQCKTKEGGLDFRYKHSQGITAMAKSVTVKDDGLVVDIPDEGRFGNVNGNHTQLAAQEMQKNPEKYPGLKHAMVTMRVFTGLEDDAVVAMGVASNQSLSQKRNDIFNALGEFDVLKGYVPETTLKLIAFKAGEAPKAEKPFTPSHLIKVMATLDNKAFPIDEAVHPIRAYSGVGGITKDFTKGMFVESLPLLAAGIQLDYLIRQYYIEISGRSTAKGSSRKKVGLIMRAGKLNDKDRFDSSKPQMTLSGNMIPKTVADSFVYPVLAAFRRFVKNGTLVGQNGQPTSAEALFEKFGPKLCDAVWEKYKARASTQGLSDFGKSSAVWEAVATKVTVEAARAGYSV